MNEQQRDKSPRGEILALIARWHTAHERLERGEGGIDEVATVVATSVDLGRQGCTLIDGEWDLLDE